MNKNDPYGLFSEEADPYGLFGDEKSGERTGWFQDVDIAATELANTMRKAKGMLRGGVATALGDTQLADDYYKEMNDNVAAATKAANPDNKEQGFLGKAFGLGVTLPLQVPAMPFSAFDTGKAFLDNDESLGKAIAATGIDTAGNMLGVALPAKMGSKLLSKVVSGGLINAGQDTLVRTALSGLADKQKTKDQFDPSWETAGLAGIIGGGVGGAHHVAGRRKAKADEAKADAAFKKALEEEAKRKPAPVEEPKPEPFKPGPEYGVLEAERQSLLAQKQTPEVQSRLEAINARLNELNVRMAEDARNAEIKQRESAFNRPDSLPDLTTPESPMQRMARDLGAEPGKPDAPIVDTPMTRMADDLTARTPEEGIAQRAAQDSLDARQEGMETDVRNRTNWDRAITQNNLPDKFAYLKDSPEVLEHPAVASLLTKVNAASEALIKASERASPVQIARLDRDLKHLETSLSKAADNVARGLATKTTDGSIPPHRKVKKIGNTLPPSFNNKTRKQGGGFLFEGNDMEGIKKVLGKAGTMIPTNESTDTILERAKGQADGSSRYAHESGGISSAAKRGSALVEGGVRITQNALKYADHLISKNVLTTEQKISRVPMHELITVHKAMLEEFKSGTVLSTQAMESAGWSVKAIQAYAATRELFKDTLRIQNEQRAAQGLPPIKELEAYYASRWQGDFRRAVYQAILNEDGSPKIDAEGNIERKMVWMLAADSKMGLDAQTRNLLKKFPDLTYDKKRDQNVHYTRRKTDLEAAYPQIIDVIGRDDPAVDRIKQYMESQQVNESDKTLGQHHHRKEKTGVRGFVGDRPDSTYKVPYTPFEFTVKRDASREALAFMDQQMTYAKNAYKWAALQDATGDMKKLVNDPDMVRDQPNNVNYLRKYFKNALGFGEAETTARLQDSLRDLGWAGVTPEAISKGVGSAKSFFILQKLAVSAGYSIAQVVQTANVIPHMMDVSNKYGGNPLKALPAGILAGSLVATGHYANFMADKAGWKHLMGTSDKGFFNSAFRYAEDNGVTARSIMDEAPLRNAHSIVGGVANAFGKTLTATEVLARSMAFMSFAYQLKDSGKFKTDLDLFQKAEDLTNHAMVDYRNHERPMVFSRMGILGEGLNTLQTYPFNYYNQMSYFAREARKGNIGPFAAAVGVQMAVGGIMAVPYMEDMQKLYHFVKDNMLSNKMWLKTQESDFWNDPKLWLTKYNQSAAYGLLSDKSGLGLTSRFTAPGLGSMVQAPGGPIADIGKQVYNAGRWALDPTNTSKAATSLHSSTPAGLQGLVETSPQMEGTAYNRIQNPQDKYKYSINATTDFTERKGISRRTEGEQTLRKFGLRSQRETVEREAGWRMRQNSQTAKTRSKSVVASFYDAVRQGNKEKATDLMKTYAQINGTAISDSMVESQVRQEFMTNMQKNLVNAKTPLELRDAVRALKLLQELEKSE